MKLDTKITGLSGSKFWTWEATKIIIDVGIGTLVHMLHVHNQTHLLSFIWSSKHPNYCINLSSLLIRQVPELKYILIIYYSNFLFSFHTYSNWYGMCTCRGVLSCERWAMSGNLWAVRKLKYLVIGLLISYNHGILASKMMILEFSNKMGGKHKQHEIQIFIHR